MYSTVYTCKRSEIGRFIIGKEDNRANKQGTRCFFTFLAIGSSLCGNNNNNNETDFIYFPVIQARKRNGSIIAVQNRTAVSALFSITKQNNCSRTKLLCVRA